MSFFGLLRPNVNRLRDRGNVQGLIKALSPRWDSATRQLAVSALGHLKAMQAVPRLIPLLNEPDSSLRHETVFALNELAGAPGAAATPSLADAVAPLITALQDEDEAMRRAASEALGRLAMAGFTQARQAADALLALTKYAGFDEMGDSAALALARLGDLRALRPLEKAMMTPPADCKRGREWLQEAEQAFVKLLPAAGPAITVDDLRRLSSLEDFSRAIEIYDRSDPHNDVIHDYQDGEYALVRAAAQQELARRGLSADSIPT
jgi:HEAT repeat protein